MKRLLTIMFIFTTLFIYADQKGYDIAKKNDSLKEAADQYSLASMILIDKKNNKKVRKIEQFLKKTSEGTNSFVRFLEPADVKNTTFLTIAHKEGDDEQRLYLPALGKVRKISSSQKDGKFMGSDLNYFDMESRELEDSEYTFLREDSFDGKDCWVVEVVSKDKNCPYSKQHSWFSKEDNFVYKIECFDKKKTDKLIKIIIMKEVKNYDGILIATKIVVDNVEDNHKTALMLQNTKINSGMKDSIFTVQNMMK